jgi:PAS domain S-box-containing protein
LFFEDQAADIELSLRALRRAGLEVACDTAVTLPEAIGLIHTNRYDIVLSDYNMPSATGLDLFRALRAEGVDIPFILVTGALGDEKAVRCLKEGMADYVLKAALTHLPVAVRHALDERRLSEQQKASEEQLRRSEASYRSLVDGAPRGIFRLSLESGRFVEVNPELVRILGYDSAGELLSTDPAAIYMDAATAGHVVTECGRLGRVWNLPAEWKRKDGTVVPVELSGRLLREGSADACLEMFAEDVSERHRAQGRICQLNRLYSVLSEVNQAIVRIRDGNELLHRICRIAVEQGGFRLAWFGTIDRETGDIRPVMYWGPGGGFLKSMRFSTSDEPAGNTPAGRAIRTGKHVVCDDTSTGPWSPEWRAVAIEHGFCSVGAVPVLVHGRAIGVIGFDAATPVLFDDETRTLLEELGADVSLALERMELERLRGQAQEELDEFFNLSEDMHCITGLDGRIHRLNHACEKVLGYTAAELSGRGIAGFVHPDDRERAAEVVERLRAGKPISKAEIRLRSKSGSYKWLLLSATPVASRGLVLAAARDISYRRSLEEQLRQQNLMLQEQNHFVRAASRMKSAFLANMSHELRTPLNCIIGFAELLHDGRLGAVSERQCEILDRVLASSRHLLRLINDILDLSKIEAGRTEFHPEPVSPAKLVEEVTSILGHMAGRKQVRIETYVCDIGGVVVDASRFKQVLYNYLSNAIKFTNEGGQVSVRLEPAGDRDFRLDVVDTGIGIAPEDLGRLFIEFQQLDSSAAKRYEGTGLGLALTKRMVEAQGGSVAVSSTLGQGSTFSAVLPRQPAASVPNSSVQEDCHDPMPDSGG